MTRPYTLCSFLKVLLSHCCKVFFAQTFSYPAGRIRICSGMRRELYLALNRSAVGRARVHDGNKLNRVCTLRALVRAIETRSAIDVYYQSLTRTGMRTICPHAFVHDGYRWHCRALSVESGEFRDYVLGRILSISTLKPSNADPSDDVEWNTHIKLRLTAHPGLDPRQKEAIEHDYRMEDGELFITMRLAAAFYFVKRYNLDLEEKIEPARQQLWLTNLAELNSALHSAKEQSKFLIAQRAKDSTG